MRADVLRVESLQQPALWLLEYPIMHNLAFFPNGCWLTVKPCNVPPISASMLTLI